MHKKYGILFLILFLTACGGGSSDNSETSNSETSNSETSNSETSSSETSNNSETSNKNNLRAVNDLVVVNQGQSFTFDAISNDSIDVDNPLAVSTFETPKEGTLVKNPDGTMTFHATATQGGWQKLSYTVSDGVDSSTGDFLIFTAAADYSLKQLTAMKQSNLSGGYVIDVYGDLWGWGYYGGSYRDVVGLGNNNHHLPVAMNQVASPKMIASSYYQGNYVLDVNGDVYQPTNSGAIKINISNVIDIVAGNKHVLFLKTDGTVWALGDNSQGQLGDGTYTNNNSVVQVLDASSSPLTNISAIATGDLHSLALKTDGTVVAWGDNEVGQLGNASTQDSNFAINTSSKLTNVRQISAGGFSSYAVKMDGTVWAWGGNGWYQLGNDSTTNLSSPVQVLGLSNIQQVTAGYTHALAINQDKQLYIWGTESGFSEARKTPVLMPDITAIKVAAGNNITFVETPQGLQSWGMNSNGELGANILASYSDTSFENRKNVIGLNAISGLTGLGTEGFEWGYFPPVWQADEQWKVVSGGFNSAYSAKVAGVADGDSSILTLGVRTASGNIAFDVRTSTEADFDNLIFSIDGKEVARFSGEQDWKATINYPVSADIHVLEWKYSKDGENLSGEDSVWIDNLLVPADSDLDGTADQLDAYPYDKKQQ